MTYTLDMLTKWVNDQNDHHPGDARVRIDVEGDTARLMVDHPDTDTIGMTRKIEIL